MKAVVIITAICLIGSIILFIKGIKDAKEIDDNSAGLSQREIDAFMELSERAKNNEDRHLSDLIDQWGKKRFGKPKYANYNDEDIDTNFLNGLN